MKKQIYYKHIIVKTENQDDVEKVINSYYKAQYVDIISINIVQERVDTINYNENALPKYWYHINIVYKIN